MAVKKSVLLVLWDGHLPRSAGRRVCGIAVKTSVLLVLWDGHQPRSVGRRRCGMAVSNSGSQTSAFSWR